MLETDRAKRACETIKLHLLADRERAMRSWVAFNIGSGESDGTLYDSKYDAASHQLNPLHYAYCRIPPSGWPIAAMELNFQQAEYLAELERAATIATLDSGQDVEVIR